MSSPRLAWAACAAFFALAIPGPATAGTIVEYYHQGLDHYFVTGLAQEVKDLDSGKHAGWQRTGFTFETFATTEGGSANSLPVCRFYGNPQKGLDSHFYSASPTECDAVKAKWPEFWLFESGDVFRVHAVSPTTGQCPQNTVPVYRLWNKRSDVNHRYTTDGGTVDAMLAKGYVLEGDGSPQRPVAFCAANKAPAQPAAGSPVCTIAASTAFPTVGSPVTLTATCTGSPATFAWANCTGSGNTCVATATAVGKLNYSLVATNNVGPSAPATIQLDWQNAASAGPNCTVSASTATPQLGSPLIISSNCSQQPTQFQWMACSALVTEACNVLSECSATSASCAPIGKQAGSVHYALIARNSAGASPKTGITVDWTGSSTNPPAPPSPTPTCVVTPSSTTPAIGTTLTLTASCTNSPIAYQWTGCSSTTSTCTTTETTPVMRTYSVAGQNAAGLGFQAQASVTWQSPATAPPVCTIVPSTTSPVVGVQLTLTASCTQSPTSYQWTNCSSTTSTCTTTSTQTGPQTYTVTGSNQFGPGSAASATLTWSSAPQGGTDLCPNYSDVVRIDLPWGGTFTTNPPNGPGFPAGAVIAARLRVPANATSNQIQGQVRFVEFIDGPADRLMTVSTSSCDFRGFVAGGASRTDPSSQSAPMAWSNGQTPSIEFDVSTSSSAPRLVPGQTYYFNLRNVNWVSGSNSCGGASCNGRFQVRAPN